MLVNHHLWVKLAKWKDLVSFLHKSLKICAGVNPLANKIVTEEDEKAMDKIYRIEGTQRRVIGIHARRKFKNSYEYECSFALGDNIGMKNEKWTPMMTADNAWIPRSEVIASHQKMVADVDQKEALASGQFRPLVRKEIESHCSNFGIDAELVSHSRMRGLSGGQRVKVVLAACSWQRPHLIVLDEPTNYLDRDSGCAFQGSQVFRGWCHHHYSLRRVHQGSHGGGLGLLGRPHDSFRPQLGSRSGCRTASQG